MNIKNIIKDNILYAIIGNECTFDNGLNFFTKDESFLQVAAWKYDTGKQLGPHTHNEFERKSFITQEFLYIKKGSFEATIYDNKDTVISKHVLKAGDFAILFYGGHGYKILEDGTEVMEVKNGPYAGPEKDRRSL